MCYMYYYTTTSLTSSASSTEVVLEHMEHNGSKFQVPLHRAPFSFVIYRSRWILWILLSDKAKFSREAAEASQPILSARATGVHVLYDRPTHRAKNKSKPKGACTQIKRSLSELKFLSCRSAHLALAHCWVLVLILVLISVLIYGSPLARYFYFYFWFCEPYKPPSTLQ